ncbi:peptidase C14 [Kribbella shirazensis]|uniref:Peptidase C14 n=1 Tax=Kribbella shirazensis TaxID=1105143 RepID=A0A7X5VBY4_9ACTN|nr:peptidase C14 [Kribbella shirazensis]NIK58410.1 hypothetical protein [Kribbella shirazensis]
MTRTRLLASTASAVPVRSVPTVGQLLAAPVAAVPAGTLVKVLGYHTAGDGGGMTVRWDPRATAPGNCGTVLDPGSAVGRWLQLHDGVGDFRRFGLFGTAEAADDALDAMVNDPAIRRIEAHTDLRFARRHTYFRSELELDFGGHTVVTKGIERNTHDNPFGAVLYFRGNRAETSATVTLAAPLAELSDVFEVPDSAAFGVGTWWAVESDVVPGGGRYERELQKLLQVTEIVDATHVRFNYQNGWAFAAGRKLTYTKVEPVTQVHVRNMVFIGADAGVKDPYVDGSGAPDEFEYTGSHPIAFEYAVRCDVSGIHATGTWWPVIMRRWCTHFRTTQCSLKNPPTVFYGGAGYLTQQIYCLYGHIADCLSSNARHLNDLTASAHCLVENCHGDGDDTGGNPFTTHGQYEHDLTFVGNSGLLDIANSGSLWGTSAKRITIRKHRMSWFVALTKITDLTLEDVHVTARSTFDPGGTFQVNADGLQLRGCTGVTLNIGRRSGRSSRPNLVSDCSFAAPPGTTIGQTPIDVPLTFRRCTFSGADGWVFNSSGPVHFEDCIVRGTAGAPITFKNSDVVITGGRWTDVGLQLTAVRDQRLHVGGGALFKGTNQAKALLSRQGGPGTVTWELNSYTSVASAGDTAHLLIDAGGNRFRCTGATFDGGRIAFAAAAFADSSYALHSRNVETAVTRDVPAGSDRLSVGDNLTF